MPAVKYLSIEMRLNWRNGRNREGTFYNAASDSLQQSGALGITLEAALIQQEFPFWKEAPYMNIPRTFFLNQVKLQL